ncbi:zinc-binding dehydrogenase [Streptomyces sp. ISL-100]|uniref:zinc-binding dehydrogenase n=1 Tax=Streptomyces sp. ISL-100 TaxID=2819173 RepID=UPI0027E43336|nr:zinc-binding dehydrogenase [Streptomyces sp. ISL-100]
MHTHACSARRPFKLPARRGGAYVIASTGNPERHGDSLRAQGAHEVVTGPGELKEPVHGVLDLVGGQQLIDAYGMLAERGTLVAVGHAAHEGETFPYGALFGDNGRHDRTIATFSLPACADLAPDLTWLAHRVAAGELDPQISWRGGWEKAADAIGALLERRLHGKAVLDIV